MKINLDFPELIVNDTGHTPQTQPKGLNWKTQHNRLVSGFTTYNLLRDTKTNLL